MNIKSIKIKKVFLAIFLIPFLAAGCGGSSAPRAKGPVVINFWKTFEDSQKFDQLIQEYQKTHPNVQIVYSKKNLENYKEDLLSALASGNGPDVFSIHNSWLPEYENLLEPAPDKVFSLKEYKNTFVDTVIQDFMKDGKIYGTAMSVDSLALYYNKDLLGSAGIATPPKTWKELENQVQRIKKSDGKGYFTRSGVAMGLNKNVNRAVDILYLLMLQKKTQPFSEDKTQATFGNTQQQDGNSFNPGASALDFYTSFANPSSNNYNWNSKSDYSVDAFANGRAAFLYSYSYMRPTLISKNPNLNFDVTTVPQPNLDDPTVNFSNYWGEVVSKQTKNPEEVWQFLKFLTSKDSLDKYYSQNKQPSSRRDLIELQAQDSEIGVFATANLTAKSFYRPEQKTMDELFATMIDNVIFSGQTPEQAVLEAQTQADTLAREAAQKNSSQ